MRLLIVISLLLCSCGITRRTSTPPRIITVSAIKSYDPDGKIVKFEWRVKGLIIGNSVTSHVSSGTTVELRVTDNNGATVSSYRLITDTSK